MSFTVLTLAVSGCGASTNANPAATTTTSVPTTTTTHDTTNAAIIDGYKAFWLAFDAAAADPVNPDDPRLAEHATGKELATVHQNFTGNKAAGHASKGSADINAKVVQVSGNSATISDCYFDHSVLYDIKTNQTLAPVDTVRTLVQATMQFKDGIWKVASVEHKGQKCDGP